MVKHKHFKTNAYLLAYAQMNSIGEEIVGAARSRIGVPFSHHFKPDNLCNFGSITVDACMEKGLSDNGYDCSGLVIASLCDVLGINTEDWSRSYRHIDQLMDIAKDGQAAAGDAVLFLGEQPHRTHIGVFVSEQSVIHASGLSHLVEEGRVEGDIVETRFVSAEVLINLPK